MEGREAGGGGRGNIGRGNNRRGSVKSLGAVRGLGPFIRGLEALFILAHLQWESMKGSQ